LCTHVFFSNIIKNSNSQKLLRAEDKGTLDSGININKTLETLRKWPISITSDHWQAPLLNSISAYGESSNDCLCAETRGRLRGDSTWIEPSVIIIITPSCYRRPILRVLHLEHWQDPETHHYYLVSSEKGFRSFVETTSSLVFLSSLQLQM